MVINIRNQTLGIWMQCHKKYMISHAWLKFVNTPTNSASHQLHHQSETPLQALRFTHAPSNDLSIKTYNTICTSIIPTDTQHCQKYQAHPSQFVNTVQTHWSLLPVTNTSCCRTIGTYQKAVNQQGTGHSCINLFTCQQKINGVALP